MQVVSSFFPNRGLDFPPGVELLEYRTPATGPLGPSVLEPTRVLDGLTVITSGVLTRPADTVATCPDGRANHDERIIDLTSAPSRADIRGRLAVEGMFLTSTSLSAPEVTAPRRTFGGPVINGALVDMVVPETARLNPQLATSHLDTHVSVVTSRIIEAEGQEAARVHGDDGPDDIEGCGANCLGVEVLRSAGDVRFADEVVQITALKLERIGIGGLRTFGDQLHSMLRRGVETTSNSALVGDSTPASRAQTAVSTGARYETRVGKYREIVLAANTGNASFDSRGYEEATGDQIFVVTDGANVEHACRVGSAYGLTEEQSLHRAIGGVLVDTAITVRARNSNLPTALVHIDH